MNNIKEMLLSAPDSQLSHSLFDTIRQWDEVPTSLQILEVIDKSVYCSLASSFTLTLLNIVLEQALERENKTIQDLIPLAIWRD